jgi:uncharacterized protein
LNLIKIFFKFYPDVVKKAMHKEYKRIQVILKTVERCNLACSYCYYFEGGDQSFKDKPPVIGIETIDRLVMFLREGTIALDLDTVWVAFHGGEPMIMKVSLFDEICSKLRNAFNGICQLSLNMQTNGYHITDEWLETIKKNDVGLSFSIDGVGEAHDKYRKTRRGKGSFEKIKMNYEKALEFYRNNGNDNGPSIISVLDASNDYGEIMNSLYDDLEVRNFNFLLPDCNHDDGIPNGFTANDYGKSLRKIFTKWSEYDDITVREVENVISRFQLAQEKITPRIEKNSGKEWRCVNNQIIVVRSDGELQIDDTFIPASEWRNFLPRINISETDLKDYLKNDVFNEIDGIYAKRPEQCDKCVWRNICNGGDLENRYSRKNGFNNPSVYCDGLKMFYWTIVKFLRKNGYPAEIIRDRLIPENGEHKYRYAH